MGQDAPYCQKNPDGSWDKGSAVYEQPKIPRHRQVMIVQGTPEVPGEVSEVGGAWCCSSCIVHLYGCICGPQGGLGHVSVNAASYQLDYMCTDWLQVRIVLQASSYQVPGLLPSLLPCPPAALTLAPTWPH
jgi:hypothetical protein